jgi:hypothetical protein
MFMPSSLKKEAIWSLKCTQPKLVSINLVVFLDIWQMYVKLSPG